ncbi:MAG TPA: 4'-phosphopantetheinyl transferase superfamily protein [Candidatus Dependentiae bacterium]|nr:4'-phosphopantetheinyl transferase superfamily protein [Candidatus Dependentiae bacterium]
MIFGVGIDSVEIKRFSHWRQFSKKTLQRIFSSEEIDYCFITPTKSAERFAVRFAIREAFFKAYSSAFPGKIAPFLTICNQLVLKKTKYGIPYLLINWEQLIKNNNQITSNMRANVSCSHTKNIATAVVILQANLH